MPAPGAGRGGRERGQRRRQLGRRGRRREAPFLPLSASLRLALALALPAAALAAAAGAGGRGAWAAVGGSPSPPPSVRSSASSSAAGSAATAAARGAAGVAAGASAVDGGSGGAAAKGRRLPVALPSVESVDFQDFDLDRGEISGVVRWVPPPDLTEITSYAVYLSDGDNSHEDRRPLGDSPVGTTGLIVGENTTLPEGLDRVFVHTRSAGGESPLGVEAEVCDVAASDTLALSAASATATPWGIIEISFHTSSHCGGDMMRWVEVETDDNESEVPLAAVDGDVTTAWTAASPADAGVERVRLVGVCRPEEVRCVKVHQCRPDGSFGCPLNAARSESLTLWIDEEESQTWTGLRQGSALRDERLTVTGRRRRAAFTVLSETPPRLEQTTHCLNNPPTFACALTPR